MTQYSFMVKKFREETRKVIYKKLDLYEDIEDIKDIALSDIRKKVLERMRKMLERNTSSDLIRARMRLRPRVRKANWKKEGF